MIFGLLWGAAQDKLCSGLKKDWVYKCLQELPVKTLSKLSWNLPKKT